MSDKEWVLTPSGVTFLTVRLRFSKTGRAKFISHLDLNRTMTRAFRRAALPIWYTEGFNKHPYVTFAAPLSLGYEGVAECMDIRLIEELSMEEVKARLNAVMPEGLRIEEAAPAVCKPADLAAAVWEIHADCTAEEWAAFSAQESVTVEKRTKKKTMKTVELTPFLQGVQCEPAPAGVKLSLTLPCNNTDTVNPSLIGTAVNAFLGRDVSFKVLRTALLDTEGNLYR